MAKLKDNPGFAAMEGLLILVILAIVGFAGYKVEQARNNTNKLNQESASQQVAVPSSGAGVPSVVNSTSDLDKAASALDKDNSDDNSADVSQIDSQSSAF